MCVFACLPDGINFVRNFLHWCIVYIVTVCRILAYSFSLLFCFHWITFFTLVFACRQNVPAFCKRARRKNSNNNNYKHNHKTYTTNINNNCCMFWFSPLKITFYYWWSCVFLLMWLLICHLCNKTCCVKNQPERKRESAQYTLHILHNKCCVYEHQNAPRLIFYLNARECVYHYAMRCDHYYIGSIGTPQINIHTILYPQL